MLCGFPRKIDGGKEIPCRQCFNCRINHKRSWVGRLHLELAHSRAGGSFLGLTYDQEHYPPSGSVSPQDWRKFYDNLRKKTGLGSGQRFFAVGEYGEESQRPHYHCLLFDVPPWPYQAELEKAWPLGNVDIGVVTAGSIDYIAGYVVKKSMGPKGEEWLKGRHPEFARMSRKPPIGFNGMVAIRNSLMTRNGCASLAAMGDVPNTFRINNRVYPMTDYWVNWLRKELDVEKPTYTPWEVAVGKEGKDYKQAARKAVQGYDRERRTRANKRRL